MVGFPRAFGPLLLAGIAACASACILVTDFDVHGTSSSSSSSVTSGVGGSGAAGGAGGAGGTGGVGGARCNADLQKDPENCGECGFSCGGSACKAGTCDQCIDLAAGGMQVDRVLVDGDLVYVVQRADPSGTGGAGGGVTTPHVRTLPLDFTTDTVPGLNHPIQNGVANGTIGTVGLHHVYVTGQCNACDGTDKVLIYACNPDDCLAVDVGPQHTELNGLTAIGDVLYYLSVGTGALQKIALDPVTGAPFGGSTPMVSSYNPPIQNAGVVELFHTLAPARLYWASDDTTGAGNGCVYRVDVDALPVPISPGLSCYSSSFVTNGFVVTSAGTVFAQDGLRDVQKIFGDPPPTMSVFDSNATGPRAVDDTYLYVTDATTHTVRAIPLAGGPSVTDFPAAPGPLYAIDATHPRYVLVTAGSQVCRWAKPH